MMSKRTYNSINKQEFNRFLFRNVCLVYRNNQAIYGRQFSIAGNSNLYAVSYSFPYYGGLLS